jgi:transposase
VTGLGINNELDLLLSIHIQTWARRPECSSCGLLSWVKDRLVVVLVDLPVFDRAARLGWHKFRWSCGEPTCPGGSWTQDEPPIADHPMALSDRSGRWITEQPGRFAR